MNEQARGPEFVQSLERGLAVIRAFDADHLRPLTRQTITDPLRLRAKLLRIRAQGWALVDQELEAGLCSIAAPIHHPDGRVVAAVNVSAPASRGDSDAIRAELLPDLVTTAGAIEQDLRGGARRRDEARL